MRTLLLAIGLMTTFLATVASAQEPESASISVKRQMVICMNKSMSASRSLSYNDAQRDCKERLVARSQDPIGKRALAANAADAPTLKNP